MSRHARQIAVEGVGPEGQDRLSRAHVLIVGAGGLAAPALPYLVGAGIGAIRLVDPDRIELSNLHRQTLFGEGDLGRPKAEVAAERMAGLNRACHIEPIIDRLDPANVDPLCQGIDLVLDCADSFAASYILSDHCYAHGLPLISASVLGRQGYAGGFCGGAPSLRAVFPDLPCRAATCASAGVLGPVVGVIGSLQAEMAIAHLVGLSPSALGRIVSFDAASYRFGGFAFGSAPEPETSTRFISASDLQAKDLLIDLRAPEEGPPLRKEMLRLTVDQIDASLPRPDADGRVVFACRSGLRAWAAAEALGAFRDDPVMLLATG